MPEQSRRVRPALLVALAALAITAGSLFNSGHSTLASLGSDSSFSSAAATGRKYRPVNVSSPEARRFAAMRRLLRGGGGNTSSNALPPAPSKSLSVGVTVVVAAPLLEVVDATAGAWWQAAYYSKAMVDGSGALLHTVLDTLLKEPTPGLCSIAVLVPQIVTGEAASADATAPKNDEAAALDIVTRHGLASRAVSDEHKSLCGGAALRVAVLRVPTRGATLATWNAAMVVGAGAALDALGATDATRHVVYLEASLVPAPGDGQPIAAWLEEMTRPAQRDARQLATCAAVSGDTIVSAGLVATVSAMHGPQLVHNLAGYDADDTRVSGSDAVPEASAVDSVLPGCYAGRANILREAYRSAVASLRSSDAAQPNSDDSRSAETLYVAHLALAVSSAQGYLALLREKRLALRLALRELERVAQPAATMMGTIRNEPAEKAKSRAAFTRLVASLRSQVSGLASAASQVHHAINVARRFRQHAEPIGKYQSAWRRTLRGQKDIGTINSKTASARNKKSDPVKKLQAPIDEEQREHPCAFSLNAVLLLLPAGFASFVRAPADASQPIAVDTHDTRAVLRMVQSAGISDTAVRAAAADGDELQTMLANAVHHTRVFAAVLNQVQALAPGNAQSVAFREAFDPFCMPRERHAGNASSATAATADDGPQNPVLSRVAACSRTRRTAVASFAAAIDLVTTRLVGHAAAVRKALTSARGLCTNAFAVAPWLHVYGALTAANVTQRVANARAVIAEVPHATVHALRQGNGTSSVPPGYDVRPLSFLAHDMLSANQHLAATPAAQAVADRAEAHYFSKTVRVQWTFVCCGCCGFSNEVAWIIAGLRKYVSVRSPVGPPCHCHGMPASQSQALWDSYLNMHDGRYGDQIALADGLSRTYADGPLTRPPVGDSDLDALQNTPPVAALRTRPPGAFSTKQRTVDVVIHHIEPFSRHTLMLGQGGQVDYLISRSMFEFDRVDSRWAEPMKHLYDEVWVPAVAIADAFERSGVPREKLVVVPEPIDVHLFDPATVRPVTLPSAIGRPKWRRNSSITSLAPPLLRRNFKFLSIYKWEPRKGWDALFRAYFATFTAADPVSLYVLSYYWPPACPVDKCNVRNGTIMLGEVYDLARRHLNKQPHELPHFEIITEPVSEADVLGLYAGTDAFVLPSRGEGWGLPVIQAMTMAQPTITTRYSGMTQFATDDTALFVEVKEEVIDERVRGIYGAAKGSKWGEPNIPQLQHQMRRVAFDMSPDERAELGARARDHIVRHFSQDVVSKQIAGRLVEIERKVRAKWALQEEAERSQETR